MSSPSRCEKVLHECLCDAFGVDHVDPLTLVDFLGRKWLRLTFRAKNRNPRISLTPHTQFRPKTHHALDKGNQRLGSLKNDLRKTSRRMSRYCVKRRWRSGCGKKDTHIAQPMTRPCEGHRTTAARVEKHSHFLFLNNCYYDLQLREQWFWTLKRSDYLNWKRALRFWCYFYLILRWVLFFWRTWC